MSYVHFTRKNAEVLVTMDGERRELKNAGIFAENGIIRQVGPMEELSQIADEVIDLSGVSQNRRSPRSGVLMR